MNSYRAETGDNTPAVVVSTASPYKFCDSVLDALGDKSDLDGVALIDRLEEVSGSTAPNPLSSLKNKTPRFTDYTEKQDMISVVRNFLK